MATSQNGWSANDRSVIASYSLPGGRVALRKGDVSVILLWVANQFHETVEPLVWPGVWGYAERNIRGSSTTLSNHASGTAIDLNAPAHWLAAVGTFSPTQVAQIRRILNHLEGVVRWGGDYSGRKDEMHFEINAGAAEVHRIADKLRGNVPVQAAAPVRTHGRKPDELSTISNGKGDPGFTMLLQECLKRYGLYHGEIDGDPGPLTEAAIKALQRRYDLTADGFCGPVTWARGVLALAGILREGEDEGNPVIEVLQNMLGWRGRTYLDRIFGDETRGRVMEVQEWGGERRDGVVGPDTRKVFARA